MDIIGKIIKALLLLAFCSGVAALAFVLIRFNLKRRGVIKAFESAKSEQIDKIVSLIESLGEESPIGGVLIPTNIQTVKQGCVVTIPENIKDFPWSGLSYKIKTNTNVSFLPTKERVVGAELLGNKYKFLAIPRNLTKTGKARNIFDPKRYIKLCPELQKLLEDISSKYPMELLSYILCGSIEFEPIDQLRVGTSAAWVQDPDWKYCPTCRKRMSLIIQLPGTSLHKKAFHEGTFFLFGCKSHPEFTELVDQYT